MILWALWAFRDERGTILSETDFRRKKSRAARLPAEIPPNPAGARKPLKFFPKIMETAKMHEEEETSARVRTQLTLSVLVPVHHSEDLVHSLEWERGGGRQAGSGNARAKEAKADRRGKGEAQKERARERRERRG